MEETSYICGLLAYVCGLSCWLYSAMENPIKATVGEISSYIWDSSATSSVEREESGHCMVDYLAIWFIIIAIAEPVHYAIHAEGWKEGM